MANDERKRVKTLQESIVDMKKKKILQEKALNLKAAKITQKMIDAFEERLKGK